MKTTSHQLIQGICLATVLGLITSAGNAQPPPDTTGKSRKVEQRRGHSTGDFCHARNKVTTLPDIPGALDLVVNDSNNQGQVVGTSFDGDFNPHGFIYADGVYTSLDLLPNRINGRGQIVGTTFDATTFESQSFLYHKGCYTSIEFPGATATFPTGINDRGQILGFYDDIDGQHSRGFIYDRGVYTTLPDVPGARLTYPQSINNRGQITGYSYDDNLKVSSFVYDKGLFTELAVPGAVNGTFASDINDQGQIVGTSSDSDFNTHSFLYEKSPEQSNSTSLQPSLHHHEIKPPPPHAPRAFPLRDAARARATSAATHQLSRPRCRRCGEF